MKKTVAGGFVRRMDHVVWKIVDGKGILLNLEDGSYFDVDPVGLSVWQSCDGRYNPDQIAFQASRTFHADLGKVSKDVNGFIKQLKRRRLVEIVPTPNRALARP